MEPVVEDMVRVPRVGTDERPVVGTPDVARRGDPVEIDVAVRGGIQRIVGVVVGAVVSWPAAGRLAVVAAPPASVDQLLDRSPSRSNRACWACSTASYASAIRTRSAPSDRRTSTASAKKSNSAWATTS
jgi:hypothetical protein